MNQTSEQNEEVKYMHQMINALNLEADASVVDIIKAQFDRVLNSFQQDKNRYTLQKCQKLIESFEENYSDEEWTMASVSYEFIVTEGTGLLLSWLHSLDQNKIEELLKSK